MKDLLLWVRVVVRTSNMKIHVAIWWTTSKNCTKKLGARAARLFFLTNEIIDLWLCSCRCRRHFLNSLLSGSVENAKCGVRSVENAECGKCGV